MIASHSAVVPSSEPAIRTWRHGHGLLALLFGLVSLLAASACDKVPLTAPTASTVTLYTDTTVIPLNGSAQITATVIESAGTVVQNGTVVTFVTTLGIFEPADARTNAGKAVVRLNTQGRSGRAIVRAFSGGNESGDLEITVGAAAVKTITLSANPSSVSASAGGRSTLSASVFDENGNGVPGIPVTFTTSAGQLLNSQVLTDGDGIARNSLTTTVQAQVQATAGAVQSNSVTIAVNNAPRVSLTTPTTVQANVQATFNYSITTDTGVGIRTARITWGDGRSDNISNTSGSIAHTYTSTGTFQAEITATDVNGETGRNTVNIFVTGSGVVGSLTINPNPTTTSQLTTFTVTPSTGQAGNVQGAIFDFGDGIIETTASLSTQHRYVRPGTFPVTVRLTYVDGRTSAEIRSSVIVN